MRKTKKKRETEVQTAILKAVKELNGFGLKLSSRWCVGVVDLLIQLPGMPTMLIEIKCPERPVSLPVPVNLTPLQRKFIRDYQRAGGYAGWIVVVVQPPEIGMGYLLYADTNPDVKYLDHSSHGLARVFGEKTLVYTIDEAVRYIYGHQPKQGRRHANA